MSSSTRTHILIVDDDPMDRMLIRRSLQELQLSCAIEDLSDGQAAIDHLLLGDETAAGKYVLVLLDLKMPKVSGITVLQRLHERGLHQQVPVVVMSSSALDEDINQSYQYGARAYITKPIQYDEFRRVVKTVGEFWGNHNHLPDELIGISS